MPDSTRRSAVIRAFSIVICEKSESSFTVALRLRFNAFKTSNELIGRDSPVVLCSSEISRVKLGSGRLLGINSFTITSVDSE